MNKKIISAALAALLISTISCSNSEKKYEEEEKSLIADYIARNNITVAPERQRLVLY